MTRAKSIQQGFTEGMQRAVEVGECLEWQGRMGNGKTIPVVKSREGKTYSADHSVPRMVWTKAKGPVPEGKIVYRKCCNNACVRLEHLVVGTRAEWIGNRSKQGLNKRTAANIVTMQRAARSRTTTLNTLEKAREVRRLAGEYPRREIAERTGVSLAVVNDILSGRAWKDHSNPWAGLGG